MADAYAKWERPGFLPPTEWTPEEEWDRIVATQGPYWEARAPMRQLGQRLAARYLLGTPKYLRTQTDDLPSFTNYIGNWIGPEESATDAWTAGSYAILLARARAAAAATRQDAGEYMSGFIPDTNDWAEAAWYTGAFNPTGGLGAAQAAQNQLAVATLLAQQKQGATTGAYGGQMGRAIAAAMQNMQQYHIRQGNPEGSFLDWYLSEIPIDAAGTATT